MSQESVTRILDAAAAGDKSASEDLLPLVYDELRRLARSYMRRERTDHTLQATALVNEVCIRLLGRSDLSWQSRAHFLAVASRAMRRVLATHARDRRAAKRHAKREQVTLSELEGTSSTVDMIALDEALTKLAALSAKDANLVELRLFGGLTLDEISLVLATPKRTIERQWRAVQAWLATQLRECPPPSDGMEG